MAWESCPMVLLAMHTYSPASVYWISFRVRDDTRAWLRTMMRPSRVWQERKRELEAELWACDADLRDANKCKSTSHQPSSTQCFRSDHLRPSETMGTERHFQEQQEDSLLHRANCSDSKHSGEHKKWNEGPTYQMLLCVWGQLDNTKLLPRMRTVEIQL